MFTAGNDVGEFAAIATGAVQGERHVGRSCRRSPSSRPLVAAVQGRAVGIGTTMLLHCDLVVLAENALLSTPFVSLALVPEAASSLLMPLRSAMRAPTNVRARRRRRCQVRVRLGPRQPRRCARQARCGSEGACVPAGKQPAGAVSATKRLMRDPDVLMAQIKAESEQFAARLKSVEAREAFTAFADAGRRTF